MNYQDDQISQLKETNDYLWELEEKRRKRQQEELNARYESSRRTASSWREALGKKVSLLREELTYYDPSDCGYAGFIVAIEACQTAMKIWDGIQSSKQSEIEELENKLCEIRKSVRLETVQCLRERYKDNDDVETLVTEYLEEGGDPDDWLN